MKNKYQIDDLFKDLDQNLKKRPSAELISRMEEFAMNRVKQIERFTIGQIISIAASFLLIAFLNFSIIKPSLSTQDSGNDELVSYQFIPLNSLYNE